MHLGRALASLLPCVMAISLSCSKCSSPAAETASTEARDASLPRSSRGTQAEFQWDVLLGEDDAANRYPFTVIVIANGSGDSERRRACSGVIIGPRLVLTAASCVCVRARPLPAEEQGTTLIDASMCETTASVMTFTYEPLGDDAGLESWSERYQGTIHPHPGFELRLDRQAHGVSTRGNLALIVLDQAVKGNTPPVPLSAEAPKPGELLTVVGYGYIEGITGLDGKRRFSQEKVLKPVDASSGQALFGQPELSSYKGDTGGPCLRETPEGPVLVGISNRGVGGKSTLTSLSAFQAWLWQEGAMP